MVYALLCGEIFYKILPPWRKNDKYQVWDVGGKHSNMLRREHTLQLRTYTEATTLNWCFVRRVMLESCWICSNLHTLKPSLTISVYCSQIGLNTFCTSFWEERGGLSGTLFLAQSIVHFQVFVDVQCAITSWKQNKISSVKNDVWSCFRSGWLEFSRCALALALAICPSYHNGCQPGWD